MKFGKLVLFAIFFLVLTPAVLAGKGLLKVEVTDCSTNSDITDAEVDVQPNGIDPTEYTDSDGFAYFMLSPGTYYITVSKSDYSTKSFYATVYSDKTTSKEICLNRVECRVSVSVSASAVGKKITSTLTLSNDGERGEYVYITAYACKDSRCESMRCLNKIDPRIYVPAYSTYTLTCEKEVTESGDYRVKATYSVCGRYSTIYSSRFWVPTKCDEKYLDSFRCVGTYRQRLYQYSDCSTAWKDSEYCTYGCLDSFCLPRSALRLGQPVVILDRTYYGKACEASVFSFDVKNFGEEGKFDVEITGPASEWVKVVSPVLIGKGERKTIVGYASLPCDVKGDYQFTVKVSDKTSDSDTTTLKVEAREEVVDTSRIIWNIIGIIIVAFAVVIVIKYSRRFLVRKPKEETFTK